MNSTRQFVLGVAMLSATVWAFACGDGPTEPPGVADPPRPAAVTVSPATATLEALGATTRLSAQVRDQNGQVMTGMSVTWATGDASVATVDATGLVTAVGSGMATVTATAGRGPPALPISLSTTTRIARRSWRSTRRRRTGRTGSTPPNG